MFSPDADTCLYIAHVAERLSPMDDCRERMNPLAYRVLARRMHQAAAGLPGNLLRRLDACSDGPLTEMLANRHFNEHGRLPGDGWRPFADIAAALWVRCRVGEPGREGPG